MFSLSAKFRKSRTPGGEGSVYYIIRQGKTERDITGNLRGTDESVMSEAKDRIAFDLMTLYCVIERQVEKGDEVTLDAIVHAGAEAILKFNPFTERLRNYRGKYPVSDDIAKISKLFSDKFERERKISRGDKKPPAGLIGYISALTAEYKTDGKPFARSLRSTQLKLASYLGNADLSLDSITPEFILDYRAYLIENLSADTVSFYIRVLRTVLRRAGKDGLLPKDFVWPPDVGLTVSRTSRKAETNIIGIDAIRRIERLDLSHDKTLELARDLFIFGFYAQGMELIDVANLKDSNLKNNILSYRRRQKGKERSVKLGENALAIIRKYHDKERGYLFPLLRRQWTYSYSTVRVEIAASMKKIGQMLNLPSGLTYSMNIYSWQSIIRSSNLAELLIS